MLTEKEICVFIATNHRLLVAICSVATGHELIHHWVCFLQLFDPRHGLVSNRDSLLRDYFMHNFFMILAPSNKKI